MKKIVVSVLAVCALSFSTFAQTEIRLGAFLGYGSDIDRGALGFLGEFMLNEKMGIQPNLAIYFPEKSGGVTYSAWEFNGNFNYYFLSEEKVELYGLGGLNIIGAKVKWDGGKASDSGAGLNLGIGSNFTVSEQILPFAEFKFTLGEVDQVAFFIGAKFKLK